jgi:hypothetical protein
MPRDFKAHENDKRAKARREFALQRRDLREPSTPRAQAVGPISHAVKIVDPETERAIEKFLREKRDGR